MFLQNQSDMNEVVKEIGNIHLTRGDMQTLNDGRWLNDQVYYTERHIYVIIILLI